MPMKNGVFEEYNSKCKDIGKVRIERIWNILNSQKVFIGADKMDIFTGRVFL